MTVTRVAGDHELADDGRQRRYRLSLPGSADAESARIRAGSDCEYAREDAVWVTVHESAGLARVRVEIDDDSTSVRPPKDASTSVRLPDGGSTLVRLPGPAFDQRLTAALDGDEAAARGILDEFAGAVPAVFACGPFLDADGVGALVGALAATGGRAADALHAARYDLVRAAATTDAGPAVDSADEFEALVAGLDAVDAIGDLEVVDALGDVVAAAHDSPGETQALLAALGYDPGALVDRGDGRFLAYYLAHVARTAGVHDARQQAARRAAATDHPDFEAAEAAAERADYWDRGAAWREAVLPAAAESVDAFAYVLANALYWTGEVARSDARADELCYEGAAAAAAPIDLEWVVGHADFERHRAAAHRHRSARNHALALSRFEAARETAGEYDFLDPWEPTYSHAVVRSNRLSAAGNHEEAVAVLDDALDELRAQGVPDDRFAEMRDHLLGQRHERRAKLAACDDDRLARLEAALDRYESVGFERSVDRIRSKLDRGDQARVDEADESGADALGPRPLLKPARESGPSLADIPDLHDFLTEPDPTAVGSADPGVLPDERGDEFADDRGGPGGPGRRTDSEYR